MNIHLLGIQTAGLDKQLMAVFVRKAHDLRLDTGTVPGANAGDGAVVHGAAVEILFDNAVGLFVGVGQVAHRLIVKRVSGAEREGLGDLIAGLQLHLGKVD